MNIESILSWGVSIGLILYTVYVLIKFYKELNSKDFDAFQEHDEPSRIASLGVLGTFIGITIGLLGFDENNIDTSVPILLSGMQTAFITSITGMIGSILMKYWQHNKQKEELSHQSSDSIDENATIATLIKYLQEKDIEQAKFNNQLLDSINLMNKSISGDGDTTLINQLKILRTDLTTEQKNTTNEIKEMVQAFNEFAIQMAENNSKALVKALEETIKDFNVKIQEQFGENFKQLNIAVGKLLVWQEEYKKTIIEVTNSQKIIFEGIEQAKVSLDKMANSSDSIQESAKSLSNIIVTAESYQKELSTSLKTLVDICQKAKQLIPTIEKMTVTTNKNIVEISDLAQKKLTNLHNKTENNINDLSTSSIKKLDDNINNMINRLKDISNNMLKLVNQHENELNTAFNKTNNAISTASDKLQRSALEVTQTVADNLVEMNKKNNEALHKTTENMHKNLENVMGESMKAFANQLALISNQFANDYTPLARKLREVVQLSKNIS